MSSAFKSSIDRIHQILKKKGVTIYLEMEGESDTSNMDILYSWEPKDKILTIVVPNEINATNKKLLHKVIKKIHDDGGLLWKNTKAEALVSYSTYIEVNDDLKTLEFFESILPSDDFIALKLSLFLRTESEKGKSINAYKLDIREKFGERGNNIANLCTAGYFEEEFKNLYLQVPREEFNKYYEMVVGDKARALFVHKGMDVQAIEEEVDKMVKKAIKYRMDDFRIHGKGKGNVEAVDSFVKSRTGKELYKITKVYSDPKFPAIEYTVQIIRKGE